MRVWAGFQCCVVALRATKFECCLKFTLFYDLPSVYTFLQFLVKFNPLSNSQCLYDYVVECLI